MLLRQFGAHVAVAIENARLFEHEREYTSTLETLSEIGREFGAILNLDELLTRIANLTRRVIDYRTFGILLVNDRTGELEMKVAVRYGDKITVPRVKLGHGIVGYAALHKVPVNVPDVSADPRYIKVVDDARSELVIPLMLQDRCIGVFDLESPELDAFSKSHVDILTLLASQAAVAIENARLYETIRIQRGAAREGDPLRAARAGGAAAGGAAQADEGRRRRRAPRAGARAGRRLLRLPRARAEQPGRRGRRRVGEGRGRRALQRVCRRAGALAHVPPPLRARALHAVGRADVVEHDPLRAAARGVLLHALLRAVRHQAAGRHDRQLRAAVSGPLQRRRHQRRWRSPASRSACLPDRPTTRSRSTSSPGDLYVFCSDGVYDANDAAARSSATSGCSRSCARAARSRRARSSTRSSPPSRNSAATRRRTTT